MSSPTDQALWQAWTAGDRRAGNALVERHFLRVHRFLTSKVGEAAEELTQRTFEAALSRSRSRTRNSGYRGDAPFRAYLFGIARKQLLRHFEGRDRDRGGLDPAEVSVRDLGPSPSGVVRGQERHAVVLNAIQRIPLDLQIVLELHYWEQMKVAEIAEVVGIPPGTVMSRLSRARRAMKQQLVQLCPPGRTVDVAEDTQALRDALLPSMRRG